MVRGFTFELVCMRLGFFYSCFVFESTRVVSPAVIQRGWYKVEHNNSYLVKYLSRQHSCDLHGSGNRLITNTPISGGGLLKLVMILNWAHSNVLFFQQGGFQNTNTSYPVSYPFQAKTFKTLLKWYMHVYNISGKTQPPLTLRS